MALADFDAGSAEDWLTVSSAADPLAWATGQQQTEILVGELFDTTTTTDTQARIGGLVGGGIDTGRDVASGDGPNLPWRPVFGFLALLAVIVAVGQLFDVQVGA